MSFVLDSSVALSWCFSDEQTAESLEILNSARTQPILVPSLWHIEMCNVLGLAFRRQRLTALDLSLALRRNLPLATLDKALASAAEQSGVTLLCSPQ